MTLTVAIIIVNWNKKQFVLELLKTVLSLKETAFDVIVVDNASTDGSVPSIRKRFREVTIIENKENLGGTGGFNSGMKYAIEQKKYKYLWLLDNDAKIKTNTLTNLVQYMEANPDTGIAGSKIMDTHHKDIVVELGGFIKTCKIGITANQRNTADRDIPPAPCEVDYVAVCSALVRSDALSTVGLMDQRFFLFWDDMDWGLSFIKHGFKVVAVPDSIVFHDAFTEKERGDLTNFYYDVRNSLLTYTKHTSIFKRLFLFSKFIPVLILRSLFFHLNNEPYKAGLIRKGLSDFCSDKWGKHSDQALPLTSKMTMPRNTEVFHNKKVLLIAGTSLDTLNSKKAFETFFVNSKLTVLIRQDRFKFFEKGFEHFFFLNPTHAGNIFYNFYLFAKLFLSGYDWAVSLKTSEFSHLSYACKKSCFFDNNSFLKNHCDQKNIYKLFVTLFLGGCLAPVITVIIFLASFKYHDGK